VTERADRNDENSLYGKKCVEGYNSHYVLVKDENPDDKNSLSYQPCDPSQQVPDYDEV
jgi:hypothetical protein